MSAPGLQPCIAVQRHVNGQLLTRSCSAALMPTMQLLPQPPPPSPSWAKGDPTDIPSTKPCEAHPPAHQSRQQASHALGGSGALQKGARSVMALETRHTHDPHTIHCFTPNTYSNPTCTVLPADYTHAALLSRYHIADVHLTSGQSSKSCSNLCCPGPRVRVSVAAASVHCMAPKA